LEWSGWFAGMMDARPADRLFNCLPMYHSVGGVVTTGAMLFAGASMVIREKFSASNFWPDLVRNQCTIFQYIGELCRYLVATPHQPEASEHRLRLCCGNGLKEDVWLRFQSRFGVPRILEYYAATEGSVSLFNCEEMPGSIGRVPSILAHRFPVALIRLDETSRQPLRNEEGLCIRCSVNEGGEAIGRIDPESLSASRRFDGYTDGTATESKILRHVFVAGDAWFRTGDVMRCDDAGFFYFVDRLGSSYRWKGENVSASEVASILMRCIGVVDAVVSGLAIKGAEGRVGVATLSTNGDFRPEEFRVFVKSNLPPYARPVLLRLCETIPSTSTFKLQEMKATSAEWAAAARDGSLWFIRPDADDIAPCDPTLLEAILSGKVRL
jgi:fatty-acyl-CoA synthase